MALSFVQWEKYIQGFPDDRLGQEFQNPGSTVPGMAPPPQNLIVSEMGNRNAARQADEAMRASQGQSSGTIAEQTYNEFAGEDRPVGGPGGGPPPGGPGGPPPGGPPMGGPPMGPGGPPPGGPPMGGPPPGGPPMMADGGLVPGYQEGGFWSGLGRMATGAGSWEDAAENPLRTLAHTALAGSMFIPGVGLISTGGKALLGGAKLGRGLLSLGAKGPGLRRGLARLLGGKKRISRTGEARRIPGGVKKGRASIKEETFWPKGHPKAGKLKPGAKLGTYGERMGAVRAQRMAASDIGRAALLRGGGAGVLGLLALDPWDGGDPDVKTPEEGPPPLNIDVRKGNAIREDTKGLYPWETEITPAARALQEMTGGQGGGDIFGDIYGEEGDMLSSDLDIYGSLFDDQLPGEWDDFGREDIISPDRRASGGIIGLQNGGINPDDPTAWDPERHWENIPEGMEVQFGDLPSGPTWAERRAEGESMWPWLGSKIKTGYEKLEPALRMSGVLPMKAGGKSGYYGDLASDILFPGFEPEVSLEEQRARLGAHGRGPAELVPIGAEDTDIASEGVPEAPDAPGRGAPGRGAPGRGAPESTLGPESGVLANYRLASLRDRMAWGQTETPQEKAVADWYRQQAETTRGRGLVELLKAGSAAAGAAATPGGIGRALRAGADAQFALADKAAGFERIPLEVDAGRSRYNTFDEQQNVLGDIYEALTSRGDINAQVQGQLNAVYAGLMEDRRITPQGLGILNEILEDQVLQEKMGRDEKNTLIDRISRQLISSYGGRA